MSGAQVVTAAASGCHVAVGDRPARPSLRCPCCLLPAQVTEGPHAGFQGHIQGVTCGQVVLVDTVGPSEAWAVNGVLW